MHQPFDEFDEETLVACPVCERDGRSDLCHLCLGSGFVTIEVRAVWLYEREHNEDS